MRLAHGQTFALLLTTALAAAACGGGGGGGGGGGDDKPAPSGSGGPQSGDGTTATEPGTQPGQDPGTQPGGDGQPGGTVRGPIGVGPECEAAWKEKLKTFKVGLVTSYEISKKVEGGLVAVDRKDVVRKVIKAVTDEAVTFDVTEQQLSPRQTEPVTREETMTKVDHVDDACLGGEAGTSATVEMLDSRTESLAVRAGSFDTAYTKARHKGTEDGSAYETTIETWTIPSLGGIDAKGVSFTTTTRNGRQVKETISRELVEISMPQ